MHRLRWHRDAVQRAGHHRHRRLRRIRTIRRSEGEIITTQFFSLQHSSAETERLASNFFTETYLFSLHHPSDEHEPRSVSGSSNIYSVPEPLIHFWIPNPIAMPSDLRSHSLVKAVRGHLFNLRPKTCLLRII